MKLLDRYLLKEFMAPFSFCLSIFSVLFIVVDVFNNLDEFLKHGVTVGIILSYYGTLLPGLIVQVVPIALLVSLLYTLGHMNKHHEIIAMKAGGVNTFLILSPYLFFGLVLSFVVLLVNELVVPQTTLTSTSIMDGLIHQGKKNMEERAIKNVTLYGSDGRVIYAREYQVLSETLHDVVIEDKPNQKRKLKIIAKKASYENGHWVFEDALRYSLNQRGVMIGEPEYVKRLPVELAEKPEDFVKEASQVSFMSAKELKEYIHRLKGSSRPMIHRLWVDFHNKIAFPFISFIVMLIGCPLAMRGERGSAMVGIGTSLVVVMSYYAIDSIFLALGKGGHLPPIVAAWFGNLLFAGIGVYLIRKST